MTAIAQIKNTGLRGIPVGDTSISAIDGAKGILLYRGFRIEDLAERSSFPETIYLLLNGKLPTRAELDLIEAAFREARSVPRFLIKSLERWPIEAGPMDVLQAAMPILAMAEPKVDTHSREACAHTAVRIIVQMAAVTAIWHRIRSRLDILRPRPELSHAANFIWQLNGQSPAEELARPLEVSMILQAEHTFNASTFACRQVAATGGGMYEAVAAGIGALSGSWHGGANARVMEMLLEMEARGISEDDVSGWVKEHLSRGGRIMGMGHPVYKAHDPRADILKRMCGQIAKKTSHLRRYRLLTRIEEESEREFTRRGKPGIKANVDFYSGLLYSMLSIPLDLMTPMFAMSLVAGWCAHIMEERFGEGRDSPVPYEPDADYIGRSCDPPGCAPETVQ